MGTAVGLIRGVAVVTEGVAVATEGVADVASVAAYELLVATRGDVAQAIKMLLDADHDLVVSLIPRRHVFVDLLHARFHSSHSSLFYCII